MTIRFTRLLGAAALACAALAAGSAHAYSSLVVFGDSLSDSGNNADAGAINPGQVISGDGYIPSFAYASGAYTNGNVWVNAFATGVGFASGALPSRKGGENYAYGGARTTSNVDVPSATAQLAQWQANNGPASADSLFVVAIGGNDIRDTLVAAATAPSPEAAAVAIAAGAASFAAGVSGIVNTLQSEGAGTIIVWTAPDVGKAPAVLLQGAGGLATAISAQFNLALAGVLVGEGNVRVFDVFSQVNTLINTPGVFSNSTNACGAAINGCDPASSLFWDGIHPTAYAHGFITQGMLAVAAVPEPGTWLMMALGLSGLVVARRRQR